VRSRLLPFGPRRPVVLSAAIRKIIVDLLNNNNII
jgi:hypothetical protein